MKNKNTFPKRRSSFTISSIAMAPHPMLHLFILVLWGSPSLMGFWAHAQEINAESPYSHGIVERSSANTVEINGEAERVNAKEHETSGGMIEPSAQQRAPPPCDVTFGDQPDANGYYRCPSNCTSWTGSAYPRKNKVVGTFTYTVDSPVCLSALHAGEIRPGVEKYVTSSSRLVNTSFVATVRNRVVSGALAVRHDDNVLGYTITPSSPEYAVEKDLSQSELVMIHNNNHQKYYPSTSLTLACLPNIRGGALRDNQLHRWNYSHYDLNDSSRPLLEQTTSSVQIIVGPSFNSRVLRCLGPTPALDVTGIFGRVDDPNFATRPTLTTSLGGTATIRYANNEQYLERLPKYEGASHPSSIGDVQLQHAGLYRSSAGSYSRLIVRECQDHHYGSNCGSWCPDCLNGGECNAATGRCVCAPGTRGRQCEDYCADDHYGAECHLSCSQSTLRWPAEGSTSCSGLTFCVRDPKGCSCLPGYKPPTCDSTCDFGQYGPDCALQCNYCNRGDCDRVTGRCLSGCKDPLLCNATPLPFNLPRLRTPPRVDGCSYKSCFVSLDTWNINYHDGELVEGNGISGYELQLRDVGNETDWIRAGPEHLEQNGNEVEYAFIPGRLYSFRVRVLTSFGTADPEYNLRLRETEVLMPCLESYAGFEFIVKEITQDSFLIAGMNDESCSPSLQYLLLIREWNTSRILHTYNSSSTALRISSLTQNTRYAVILDSTSKSVTTLQQPPYPPTNITIDSISSSVAWAKWSRPERADRFITTLQIVMNEGCSTPNRGPINLFNTTDERRYLSGLIPYQRYEFCVMAANAGGQSTHRCVEFVTTALHVPDITLSNLQCIITQKQLTCSVIAPDDCELLNGPEPNTVWELSGGPACNSFLGEPALFNETYKPGTPWKAFTGLYPLTTYTVEVHVRNQVGRGLPLIKKDFQTLPAKVPGPVQQLEVTSTSTSLVLRWSPPCPPLAPVSSYEVAVDMRGNGRYTNVSLPLCPGQQDQFCYTNEALIPNTQYVIRVRSCAHGRKCSEAVTTKAVTEESAPGAPVIKMTERDTNAVYANFTAPPHLGAGAACYLAVINEGKTVKNFTQGDELAENVVLPYTVADLAPSLLLMLMSRCCNRAGCSRLVELSTSTLLAPLEDGTPLRVEDISDTNATLLLPTIKAGDADISLVVFVQNITGKADTEPANFTAHHTTWKQNQRQPGRKRRSDTNQRCSEPSPSVYVAGTAEQNQQKFVLGSGVGDNCELTAGNSYRLGVVVEATLQDQVSVSVFQPPGILIAGGNGVLDAGATLGIIVAIVLLLVITIAVIMHRKMKQRPQKQLGLEPTSGEGEKKGVMNTLRNRIHWDKLMSSTSDKKPLTRTAHPSVTVTDATPPPVPEGDTSYPLLNSAPAHTASLPEVTPMPGQSPKPSLALMVNPTSGSVLYSKPIAAVRPVKMPEDTIYNDLAEEEPIYGNDSAIPVQEIEAYLNQTINSSSIVNDFMVVPKNYPKLMSDGELPQNKHKNRYRNNLPYNETRVRLNIINDDPCSDYINASHVQGVTPAKHYIAAQGPKDSDDCTIPDFWRMVVENNVNVIIMVANFVEKSVVKVGTYFSSKGPIALKPLGGSVHVVSQNITPYCTISVLQVTHSLHGSSETLQVTHYHYTKWPDHGVPKEIHTLAQMLHHIANNHQTMCALVHCSAGIGRTGTVIFDLLCYDHLVATQKLDLIAVLVHLRQSRARLVENQMQFKLGLQLLDEILFGFSNVTSTSSLQNSMPQLLEECQTMFSKLSGLPSSLEYKTGARGENIALNRSPDILPADSRMIFFQNHSGQSPYINAVSLDSHSEADAYIITEHPLAPTLEPFWEMVKQKASPILVVLNNSIDEEYPQMFADEVDGQMTFGSTVVTTTTVRQVCQNLVKRDINVESGRSTHSVVMYEVEDWPRGAAVPPDHTVLTRLADIILGGSLRSANPPVLVCSDGVTACGLMAGALRVVERVKQCQDVDIYRTAVMLKRCRQEFVVDHVQLQTMLRVAFDYLSSFQDYDNFK